MSNETFATPKDELIERLTRLIRDAFHEPYQSRARSTLAAFVIDNAASILTLLKCERTDANGNA